MTEAGEIAGASSSDARARAAPPHERVVVYDRIAGTRGKSLLLALLAVGVCLGAGVVMGLLLDMIGVAAALLQIAGGRQPPDPASLLFLPRLFGICAAFLSLPLVGFAWFRSRSIVLRRASARRADHPREREFSNVVDEIAIAAGIVTPSVAILDLADPNSMSIGSGRRASTVVATTGLLDLLDRPQLQAVVSHEIAHVVNGDVRFQTFFAALTLFLGRLQVVFMSMMMPATLLAPLFAVPRALFTLTTAGALREREYLADDVGALLCRDPRSMISALQTIGRSVDPLPPVSGDLTHLLIVGPEEPGATRAKWSDTHPPLQLRIERLRQLL